MSENIEERVNESNLFNRRMFEKINGKWTLVGRKCKSCGSMYIFPKVTCPNCLQDSQFETIPFSGKGKLFSFTVNSIAPLGFTPPSVVGYVNLLEGPRLFSVLDVQGSFDKLRLGMDVEMIIGEVSKDEKGNSLYCYVFRPV